MGKAPGQAAAHRPSPPIRPTSNMQLVFAGRWPAPVGGGLVGERRRPGGLGSAVANMTYLTSLGYGVIAEEVQAGSAPRDILESIIRRHESGMREQERRIAFQPHDRGRLYVDPLVLREGHGKRFQRKRVGALFVAFDNAHEPFALGLKHLNSGYQRPAIAGQITAHVALWTSHCFPPMCQNMQLC